MNDDALFSAAVRRWLAGAALAAWCALAAVALTACGGALGPDTDVPSVAPAADPISPSHRNPPTE